MAAKKSAKKSATKRTAKSPTAVEPMSKKNLTESPISTTGATHVFRADLGESLPAQEPARKARGKK